MRLEAFAFLLLLFPVYAASVTTFVSPDSSFAAVKGFLTGATQLKIASYTFTSKEIADMLPVGTVILVDGSPAGGLPQESEAIFCNLEKKGIDTYLYSGPLRYMHAKYIVKGSEALITSENFGGDGFPVQGSGNRGWGAIVEDEDIANQLSKTFDTDIRSSTKFVCDGNYTVGAKKVNAGYAYVFTPKRFANQNVSLIVAPNALPQLLDMLDNANNRLLIQQMYIYRYFDKGRPNLLLDALVSAANRSVDVSVLLDGSYYNVERDDKNSNYYTNTYLNNASVESKLFTELTLHNKGVVADDAVLISSINWNENSPTRNREIGIVIEGEAADYFASVFDYDFAGNRITGLASAINYIELALVPVIVIFLLWMRKKNARYKC